MNTKDTHTLDLWVNELVLRLNTHPEFLADCTTLHRVDRATSPLDK